MDSYIVKGDLCFSETKSKLKSIKNGYLVVENGLVVDAYKTLPDRYRSLKVYDYSNKLIIPGLSDLHVHAPQYQFRGLWMDLELLEWLEKHTFPEEAKYSDLDYADIAYSIFADDLKKSPTTRIAAFSTLHTDATLLLMRKLSDIGVKGYVGKVSMDRNSPDILIEDTEDAIKSELEFLDKASSFEQIKPIVTPRFIPSCSDKLLYELGKIAKEMCLPVQSHLSENLSEIDWVKSLVPSSSSYADAYRLFGLWGETPTIMAHCTWSDKFEDEMMQEKNIFIAHCPDSNTNLTSGVAAAKHFLTNDCNIGLGSDIAAGETLFITKTIVDVIKASKLRKRLYSDDDCTITFPEAFYMASEGGGKFFGKTGSFKPGFDADFLVLDEEGINSTLINTFSVEERLERYCYLAGEKPVLHKAVAGRILF